ncbi:hypothetical protein AVEN_136397-1 [Araneus ventricosus]|uniref:Transposase Tc1-like domain-containing protein n=1 Tax=Araneus ventricosus TaxID=182803 RepID=A0A4Y2N070_ARAVE|nr:hypothetical protein AVEN_136397-1 [Araneus ventricosus]
MTVTPAVDAKVLVVIKEKGRRRIPCPLGKAKSAPDSFSADRPIQCRSKSTCSEHTVQRTLLDMGLCSRHPTRVPLLTKRHRQLRLQWAREHRDWTMDEWKRVAWSDESRFLIYHVDGHVRVRRLPGEQMSPLVQQVIHRLVVAVLCFGGRSHGRLWDP